MINKLIQYFENFVTLNQDEKEFIEENIPPKKLNKNHLLLAEGNTSKEFYFVLKGAIRLFYNTEAGEKTAFFYFENMFVSSFESFTRQIPAKHNLQTVEDSIVAVISYETAQKLLKTYPKFDFLARIMLEEELIVCQEIISSFITMSAEKRYLRLIETNSPLLHRIPQHQLSTFLGITPETLSRIRKRIT